MWLASDLIGSSHLLIRNINEWCLSWQKNWSNVLKIKVLTNYELSLMKHFFVCTLHLQVQFREKEEWPHFLKMGRLTLQRRLAVINLRERGYSYREIVRVISDSGSVCSTSTIRYLLRKYGRTKSLADLPRRSRTR